MNKRWDDEAWLDYVDWQVTDGKITQRINALIKDIERWSRRIDEKNRLVYDIDENGFLYILACKGHYE